MSSGKKSLEKQLRKIPFLKIFLPLLLGIITGWYAPNIYAYQIHLLFTGIILIGIVFFFSTKWSYFLGIISLPGTALLFFSLGIQLIHQKDVRNNNNWYGNQIDSNTSFLVQLIETPVIKQKSIRVSGVVKSVFKNNKAIYTKGGILLYLSIDSESRLLKKFDFISFTKVPGLIRNDGNPGEFNQHRYWLSQQITHRLFLGKKDWHKQIRRSNKPTIERLTGLIDQLRTNLLSTLQKFIKNKNALGFAEALLIGYKNDLDSNTNTLYANMGVVHIIAISGLHVGLVFWLLQLITSPLTRNKKSRTVSTLFNLLLLWCFGALTGGGPSVLRSVLLFTCLELGRLISRNANSINSMAVSAFLLVCYNPFWVWDIGFQLSYVAVLSILLYYDKLNRVVEFSSRILNSCWSSIALTASAQILTTPISIYWFHQFPTYFLLSNFIAVPLSGFILFLEIFLLCLQFFEPLAFFIGKSIVLSIQIMNYCIEALNKLPYSLIDNLSLDFSILLFIYLLIIAISYGWFYKSIVGKHISFILLIQLTTLYLIKKIQWSKQQKIVVYNFSNSSAIEIIKGRESILYIDSITYVNAYNLSILKNGTCYFHINKSTIVWVDSLNYSIPFENRRLLWCRSIKSSSISLYPNDWVLVTNKTPLKLIEWIHPRDLTLLIIDKSVKTWKKEKWLSAGREKMLKCYCIDNLGAFVSSLR